MATITLNPTGQSVLAHAVSGGSNYAVLADSSDSSYIYAKATESAVTTTSVFQMGNSNSIAGRFVVTGISTMIRNRNGASGMNTSSMSANLYVGGIEGRSWGNSLGTSWTDRTHTSGVNEFSVLDGKLLTSLPQILLHIASVLKVNKTGDDKWNGVSKASVTLTYDNYYVQSAQGSTGVTASVSNNTTAVSGYYKSGSITTYSATLDSSYGFKGWFDNPDGTGTPVSTALSYQETCGYDRVLYAVAFQVSANGSTGVSASLSRGTDGKTFTFSANLNDNFAFDGWYNGNSRVSRSLSYSQTLDSGLSLTAKAFSISYSGDVGISVSALRSSDGLSYTFTGSFANAPAGSVFTLDKWTINGSVQSSSDTTLTVTVNANTNVTVSSLKTSVEGDANTSVSIVRNSAKSVTMSASVNVGYDFSGWYLAGSLVSSSLSHTLSPTASGTYTAQSAHHIYALSAVADAHCTASVSSPDHYYGTTATFTAAVTDNQYTFAGWYEDPSFTTLYSTALVTSYVITGDKTLYAKTIPLNKFFLKVGNTWKTISKVFRKTNNAWVEVSISDYTDLFDTQQPYLKDDNREH